MIEHLLCICEVQGSIPDTKKKNMFDSNQCEVEKVGGTLKHCNLCNNALWHYLTKLEIYPTSWFIPHKAIIQKETLNNCMLE